METAAGGVRTDSQGCLNSRANAAGDCRTLRVSQSFTLVELLVVVGVIALLAAVLFPVLVGIREKAAQSACLNNLKQIGHAFVLYLDDWDDAYPWVKFEGDSEVKSCWQLGLLPYLRDVQVLACPSNPYRWWFLEERTMAMLSFRIPVSYAMNSWAFRSKREHLVPVEVLREEGVRAFFSSDVREPESLIVVGESRAVGKVELSPYDALPVDKAFAQLWDPPLAPWQGLLHSHRGKVNFLFADWHARPMRVMDTYKPKNLWVISSAYLPEPYLSERDIAPEYR